MYSLRMGKAPEPGTRKSVTLPNSMWVEVAEFRFLERIGSEAEALRRLVLAGLRAEAEARERNGRRSAEHGRT